MDSLQEDIKQLIHEAKTDIEIESVCGKYSNSWQEFNVPAVGDTIELDYLFFTVISRRWERTNKWGVCAYLKVEIKDVHS